MEYNFKGDTDYFKDSDKIRGLTVGSSMLPLFRDKKDIVTVEKLTEGPKINDVLLYRKKGTDGLVLHRLLKITDKGFVIRGDNLYYKETDVTSEDIVGIMTCFERNGKNYDCKTSRTYKMYVIYIRCSYPIRRLIHKGKSFIKVVKRYYKNKTAK